MGKGQWALMFEWSKKLGTGRTWRIGITGAWSRRDSVLKVVGMVEKTLCV